MSSSLKKLLSPLRLIWRRTGEPMHRRLFRRYIDAIIGRLDALFWEVGELRREVGDVRARQEELDARVGELIAAQWDMSAMSRRLADLEDHVVPKSTDAGAR